VLKAAVVSFFVKVASLHFGQSLIRTPLNFCNASILWPHPTHWYW